MLIPSNSAGRAIPASTPKGSPLPWYAAVIGCVYYLCLAIFFLKTVPSFTALLDGLNVEIPLPARLLLSNHTWLVPALYLTAVALTIARLCTVLSEHQKRIANWFLFFAGAIFPALLVLGVYSPLLLLTYQLHFVK